MVWPFSLPIVRSNKLRPRFNVFRNWASSSLMMSITICGSRFTWKSNRFISSKFNSILWVWWDWEKINSLKFDIAVLKENVLQIDKNQLLFYQIYYHFQNTSGKVVPRTSQTVGTRLAKKPGLAFSFSVAYRTPRRKIRRNTYLHQIECQCPEKWYTIWSFLVCFIIYRFTYIVFIRRYS